MPAVSAAPSPRRRPRGSSRQYLARVRNGLQSHGPVTPEGRRRSASSGFRHGLASAALLFPEDDAAVRHEIALVIQGVVASLGPRSAAELRLARRIGASAWRVFRADALENLLLNLHYAADPGAGLGSAWLATHPDLTIRYISRWNQEFWRRIALYLRARLPVDPVPLLDTPPGAEDEEIDRLLRDDAPPSAVLPSVPVVPPPCRPRQPLPARRPPRVRGRVHHRPKCLSNQLFGERTRPITEGPERRRSPPSA